MNLVYVVVVLAFYGIALVALVALIIACIMRKWKVAGFIGTFIAIGAALLVVVAVNNDRYVRKPVVMAELTGTYRPSPNARSAFSDAGYRVLTGELALRPDGTFTATRIPSCIFTGEEPRKSPSNHYYDFSGSWKTGMSPGDSSVAIVEFTLSETKLFDVPSQGSPLQIQVPKNTLGPAVNILRGTPLSLGFQIFNGDFYDIDYSAQPP